MYILRCYFQILSCYFHSFITPHSFLYFKYFWLSLFIYSIIQCFTLYCNVRCFYTLKIFLVLTSLLNTTFVQLSITLQYTAQDYAAINISNCCANNSICSLFTAYHLTFALVLYTSLSSDCCLNTPVSFANLFRNKILKESEILTTWKKGIYQKNVVGFERT